MEGTEKEKKILWSYLAREQGGMKRKFSGGNGGRAFKRGPGVIADAVERAYMAHTDWKYFDTDKGSTAIPASADWTATEVDIATALTCFSPVKGDDIMNRTGRKCEVYKWKVRGSITVPKQTAQTTGDNAGAVRVVFFWDKQTNGLQAQGEDVMRSSGTATNNVLSFASLANLGKFDIAYDKTFVLQNPNMCQSGVTNFEQHGEVVFFKFTKVYRNPLTVKFNAGNAGDITDIINWSPHCIATQMNTDLAASIAYSSRICYKNTD